MTEYGISVPILILEMKSSIALSSLLAGAFLLGVSARYTGTLYGQDFVSNTTGFASHYVVLTPRVLTCGGYGIYEGESTLSLDLRVYGT